jgi:hypothetical protein
VIGRTKDVETSTPVIEGIDEFQLTEIRSVRYSYSKPAYTWLLSGGRGPMNRAVAETVDRSVGSIPRFVLWTPRRTIRLAMSLNDPLKARPNLDRYVATAEVLSTLVMPRIARETAERVRAGETVRLAGCRLSTAGIRRGTRFIEWSDVKGAGLLGGFVTVVPGSAAKPIRVGAGAKNALVLATFVQMWNDQRFVIPDEPFQAADPTRSVLVLGLSVGLGVGIPTAFVALL